MFNYKSKIRKRAACRAEAARSVSVLEIVDVDFSFEVCREFGEISVESVDVIFDGDEVVVGVVEIVEAGIVFKVVKMFGRDVENLVIVVAGRDS